MVVLEGVVVFWSCFGSLLHWRRDPTLYRIEARSLTGDKAFTT
jgi:hypothetical protein